MRVMLVLALCGAHAARAGEPKPPSAARKTQRKDPYKDAYAKYKPDFLNLIQQRSGYGRAFRGWVQPEKKMRLSSEPSFFTLNYIQEDSRANALVDAALEKEAQGRFRDALKMYQIVIEKHPRELYRISNFGVFVPISQYCQRRILSFPRGDLAHYRTLFDARARETFENARRKHSLIGLSEVVDTMLATSYGGRAILELGNSALDTGHYLEALERFGTIRDFFPDRELRTPELDLKVAYCRKMLGAQGAEPRGARAKGELSPEQLNRLKQVLTEARPERPPYHSQLASGPHVAADDYTLFPPTADPLMLTEPVWTQTVPGSQVIGWRNQEHYVFSQPVVSGNSIIYRYKNVVYCRSILNGELRWENELGGRAVWQNRNERQYPMEDVVVQDGLVFSVISKGGPSLVALDEVTGQLKWAYGPMVAATEEEARMRFEAAPAGGPRTIYAGYVLDNIEGETHTDTEYGLIAFESATGRLRWRRALCCLAPGKFSGGFAEKRRNRIRSFTSPPLYHQGTVYYNTNAGAIAAVDSRSGRIKWLMRYPYWPSIHDATRQFGALIHTGHWYKHPVRPHSPMFWYNQRPLMVGEGLYILPVDTRMMLCLDRRTGQVRWSKAKATIDSRGYAADTGCSYLLGPTREGHLVLVYSGRLHAVQLIDPATGKTVWRSGDLIKRETQPVMNLPGFTPYPYATIHFNRRWPEVTARPFLTSDDTLYVGHTIHVDTGYSGAGVQGWCYHLTQLSLASRRIVEQRRHYSSELLAYADQCIRSLAPQTLKELEDLPHKNKDVRGRIGACKAVIKDTVPANRYGSFLPGSRITFRRYGVPFEFRFNVREISMVYDRPAVEKAIAGRNDPAAIFARAELAAAEARYDEAARLLNTCLAAVSSEDLDFRATINQLLFRIYRRLARAAVRAGNADRELQSCLGMSRTASTLADEIETLFALSEAYERKGDLAASARCLRSTIAVYGHHEYPVAEVAALDPEKVMGAAQGVLTRARAYAQNPFFGPAFQKSVALLRKGLPLYLSTVSPLPKSLTVRAGELAAARLARLQELSPESAARLEAVAERELRGRSPEEQIYRLWEFPGTAVAQKLLVALFESAAKDESEPGRRRRWQLADAARVCGLKIPEAQRARVSAPPAVKRNTPITLPQRERPLDLSDPEGINWLVLERRGQHWRQPHLLFVGGRVRKRLDNKFVLACVDLKTGTLAWKTDKNIRLRGRGQEPGFFEAFVHDSILVVHGLYDVLAYDLRTRELRWRYRVPFDFEIKGAIMSGDLLVLTGKTETLALYIPTPSRNGEVVWQVKEMGDLYIPSYFHRDRLVSVRKMPFNVTVRYRVTGKLIGRLALPDLSLHAEHPLLDGGPRALPAAHDGKLLAVSDGWYYILLDIERMATLWKRLIDNNDLTREPAMRFALSGRYLAVLKEDYDQKVIYMLSTRTGEVLWHTDPKNARSPQPMHSMHIDGDRIFGIGVHPGQGFHFVGRDCKTGKLLFQRTVTGYNAKPHVALIPPLLGTHVAVRVQDRQDFELRVFDTRTGKLLHTMKKQGVGPFGVHGRVSTTVQNGRLVLLSKDQLSM